MTIYAKRINPRQRALLRRYEDYTGIEPMHQDDLDSGEMTFYEVWHANIDFLFGVYGAVSNFDTSGTGA